ncbi:MAG: helix-turn-helix domain-containing protein [Candidatus Gygaella obscura]|nr:helix-turn-helix domain-containing protein [Candidatus Gygaella obscura]
MDKLLTPKQLSELLQIKLSTVYKWSHYGYVPYVRIGDLVRFKEKRIKEWLKKRERKGRKSLRIHAIKNY